MCRIRGRKGPKPKPYGVAEGGDLLLDYHLGRWCHDADPTNPLATLCPRARTLNIGASAKRAYVMVNSCRSAASRRQPQACVVHTVAPSGRSQPRSGRGGCTAVSVRRRRRTRTGRPKPGVSPSGEDELGVRDGPDNRVGNAVAPISVFAEGGAVVGAQDRQAPPAVAHHRDQPADVA